MSKVVLGKFSAISMPGKILASNVCLNRSTARKIRTRLLSQVNLGIRSHIRDQIEEEVQRR